MEITILAEDIRNSNYMNSQDCAITRALKRAGLELEDIGVCIVIPSNFEYVLSKNTNSKLFNQDYQDLTNKVVKMYNGKSGIFNEESIPPEDFTVDLPLEKYLIKAEV